MLPRLNSVPFVFLSTILWTSVFADLSWWQKSAFYQIYPRSYQDTDGNGIGDLKGMLEHVEYLKDLGVTGIWMNPIYDSPLKDFGYDISNYTSIDKTFGTFSDFSALVDKIHSMGMQILVDMVPNHTSDEHPWFQNSKNKVGKYTDYYVWHDAPSGLFTGGKVPNNWQSVFGGTAWTYDDGRGQYYYHAFLVQQPDLNYRNPDVVNEMKNVLKFWLDLGVDGFRVDAVPFLVEDAHFRDEPACNPPSPGCLNHIYTQNLPDTYEALQDLYQVVQNYTNSKYPGEKIMVLEVYADIKIVQNYFQYNGKKTSTMPFNFQLINVNMETNGTQIKNMVDLWTNNLIPGGWSNWVTGNHDQNRVGHKVGVPMTDGMNMINILLPGTSFSYYGEELGMDDTYVDCYEIQDTQAINQAHGDCGKMESISRDPERTPMQWNSSENAGFSNHKTWLPVNPDYYDNNVENQKKDPKSHLNIFKHIISLKKEMQDCKNLTTLAPAEGWVFAFQRFNCNNNSDSYVVIANFNNQDEVIDLTKDFKQEKMFVRIASRFSDKKTGDEISLANLNLRPKEGLVLATVSSASHLVPCITIIASLILVIVKQLNL